jgi:phosphatidylglycerophosphatase A
MTPKEPEVPASVFRNPIHFLAFGFGSGVSPVAPGTAGTLVAVPLYLALSQLSLPGYIAMLLVSFGIGVWLCERTSRDLGVHDHGGIVWDEFVGYWLTMLAAPAGWHWVVVGFLLFRLFDILKPFPIGYFDRQVKGGFGIMLDDVLAAVYAWICLQGLVLLF